MKVRTTSILVSAALLFITIGLALAAARDPVSGSGAAALNLTTGLFEGTVDLTIAGEEFEDIPFAVAVLAPLVPNEEGVLHVEATHTFDFGDDGTFTTQDRGVAEPIDEYGLHTLNETLTITSGTGDFEGASGVLHAHGELDLGGLPSATFDIRGVICR